MNQIFPEFPKDIRKLLWNSYLNELDRYIIFLTFLPNARRKSDRRLTELAGEFGGAKLIQWMNRNNYGIDQLYLVIGKYGRIDLFEWVYTNICQPFRHLLHECVEISIYYKQFDFCVWICSMRKYRVDLKHVIWYLETNNLYSLANEIIIKGYFK